MPRNSSVTLEWNLELRARGRKKPPEAALEAPPAGRLPRITRLMALAVKFDGMLREGIVTGYADLARLGLVTRARMTQIMSLLHLAPDIQEEILFLPKTMAGRDPISERSLRVITSLVRWDQQREAWREMRDGSVKSRQTAPARRAS